MLCSMMQRSHDAEAMMSAVNFFAIIDGYSLGKCVCREMGILVEFYG